MRPGLFTNTLDVLRVTAYVLDAQVAEQTLTVSRQPTLASLLQVEVTFTGLVAGVTSSETITVPSGGGTRRGVKQFTSIATATASGLGTASVMAIDVSGQPQATTYAVATSIPARFDQTNAMGRYFVQREGSRDHRDGMWSLDWSDVFTPRIGDRFRENDTGNTWLVTAVDVLPSPLKPLFFDCQCERYDSTR
jgi:hypothetical protein